jgi:hypothetical protein
MNPLRAFEGDGRRRQSGFSLTLSRSRGTLSETLSLSLSLSLNRAGCRRLSSTRSRSPPPPPWSRSPRHSRGRHRGWRSPSRSAGDQGRRVERRGARGGGRRVVDHSAGRAKGARTAGRTVPPGAGPGASAPKSPCATRSPNRISFGLRKPCPVVRQRAPHRSRRVRA